MWALSSRLSDSDFIIDLVPKHFWRYFCTLWYLQSVLLGKVSGWCWFMSSVFALHHCTSWPSNPSFLFPECLMGNCQYAQLQVRNQYESIHIIWFPWLYMVFIKLQQWIAYCNGVWISDAPKFGLSKIFGWKLLYSVLMSTITQS